MDRIEALNRGWFLYFNGGVNTPSWLVLLAGGIAEDLIYLIPLLLAGFWLWGDRPRRELSLKACLVALLGVAANQAISVLWPHPRPFVLGLGHSWMPHAPDSSFPSDHVAVFGGVGLTLLLDGAAAWGVAALMAGVAVAWARVFLGVHFPLDMAGALAVAAVSYGIMSLAWLKAGRPLTDIIESLYRRLLAKPIAIGWIRG